MTTSVLVAGATGVLGRRVAAALRARGHRVLGLARGPRADIRADLTDRDGLLRAVAGHRADVVVHAATQLARPPLRHRDLAGTDRLRTVGMRNLVEAAAEVGATRLVGENVVLGFGYEDHGPGPLTEADPFGPVQADARVNAHVAAMREKEWLTLRSPGFDGISLRFGLFYGPDATDALLPALRRRAVPVPRPDGRVLPWVHVDDAAAAVVLAVESDRTGGYCVADDVATSFADHLTAVAAAFGAPRPRRVPVALLRPAALLHATLRTNLRVDSSRARAELGWSPRHPDAVAGLAAMTAAASAADGTGAEVAG